MGRGERGGGQEEAALSLPLCPLAGLEEGEAGGRKPCPLLLSPPSDEQHPVLGGVFWRGTGELRPQASGGKVGVGRIDEGREGVPG